MTSSRMTSWSRKEGLLTYQLSISNIIKSKKVKVQFVRVKRKYEKILDDQVSEESEEETKSKASSKKVAGKRKQPETSKKASQKKELVSESDEDSEEDTKKAKTSKKQAKAKQSKDSSDDSDSDDSDAPITKRLRSNSMMSSDSKAKKHAKKDNDHIENPKCFSRIKEDAAKNTKFEMMDNTFEAKKRFGAVGDAYGELASEKLIQTRGKGFRKEKTKMKNKNFHAGGSKLVYAVNSIKF